MKDSKCMMVAIATYLLTWFVLSLIVYLLNDMTLKATMSHPFMLFIMFIAGWIPAVVITNDYNDRLK